VTLERAGLKLAQEFSNMGLELSVGIGDCELVIYKPSKLNTPLLKSMETDGYEGYPVRIVFTGRVRPATQTEG
jgi:hypothetical protein